MSLPGCQPYTASKHAVLGITKTAALEARNYGIRVNAISPGFLLTNLLTPVVGNAVPQEMWEAFVKRQGRLAGFEEIGDVVVLMTSPRMSLVNGANLHADK
jgi:NAD(P)-dependent dehydrogenase (short-subunit alcohol dehydrogenase family)